jgi:pimeloyl-ACP methyl ester carboxylesterase
MLTPSPMGIRTTLTRGSAAIVSFIAVDGAAHASSLTHPDEVNQAVLRFLTGLDGG